MKWRQFKSAFLCGSTLSFGFFRVSLVFSVVLKGFNQRLSAKISGKNVLIFSASPCLRGGFWYLIVA
jgi:hypothetical protein